MPGGVVAGSGVGVGAGQIGGAKDVSGQHQLFQTRDVFGGRGDHPVGEAFGHRGGPPAVDRDLLGRITGRMQRHIEHLQPHHRLPRGGTSGIDRGGLVPRHRWIAGQQSDLGLPNGSQEFGQAAAYVDPAAVESGISEAGSPR